MRPWSLFRCEACPRTYVRKTAGNGLCEFCISLREAERQKRKRDSRKKIALDSHHGSAKDDAQHGDCQDR